MLCACVLLTLVVACSAPASAPDSAPTTATPPASAAAGESDPAAPPSHPMAACAGVERDQDVVEIAVQARSFAFDTQRIEGARHCQPFVIEFTNLDEPAAVATHEHNIFIRLDGVLGELAFEGKSIGTGEIRYEVPGLPAGTHYFYCSLHASSMKGDLVVTRATP